MNMQEKASTPPALTEASTHETEEAQPEPHSAAKVYEEELRFIASLPQPDPMEIAKRRVLLGTSTKKNVLVLDLDETLVFSLQLEGLEELEELGIEDNIAIRVRPYARELLQRLKTLYELVVFTAAEEAYAKRVVDLLDPSHECITKILSREHCVPLSTGVSVKDLRIFADRSLEHVLIADNNIFSFAFQLPNGIPVTSYDGANDDDELEFLTNYLEVLGRDPQPVTTNSIHIGLQPRTAK
jgi:CTD small phosphatase-like protein 2